MSLKGIATTLAAGALGALAGCGGSTEGAASNVPAEEPGARGTEADAVANIDVNLERLRGLEVIGVGALLTKLPAGPVNCYGPCPGNEAEEAKVKAQAAVRLQALADAAEGAVKTPAADACADAVIDQNLAALKALEIVQVTGFLKAEPKNNPNCYNQPCIEDTDAAKAVTCERAGKLASIAKAAKGL